jgi:Carboxypeptidase regulatory-like domain
MRSGKPFLFLCSLLAPVSIAVAQDQPSQAAPSFSLSGIVTDESKAPIASVELQLGRHGQINRLFRTGTDGRFSFNGVGGGPVSLTARRLGYRARSITLDINEMTVRDPVSVVLQTIPGDVAPVLVEGTDSRLDAFYRHKRENTFGRFIEQTEIERRGPVFASELFRTVPGAIVKPSGRLGYIVRLRGCQPMIWVDGIHVLNAEIDDVVSPPDIAGIEIYNSWSTLPSEYMDRQGAGCGAIAVWTKSR